MAGVGIGDVFAVGELDVGVVAFGLIRLGARAADVEINQTRGRERIIADEFGFEPARRLGGIKTIALDRCREARAGGWSLACRWNS